MNRLVDTLEKQDRLPANRPYSGFYEAYQRKANLYPTAGYRPLFIRAKRLQANKAVTQLILELATPPVDFVKDGISFQTFETEGAGGRMVFYDLNQRRTVVVFGGLTWGVAGMTLAGDPAILVGGNKVNFAQDNTEAFISVISTVGILHKPIMRLRRVYDTVIAAEVVGVGNGTKVLFEHDVANVPICPGSISISYTGNSDVIRDDGAGRLVCVPPDVQLGGVTDTIDYATGKLKMSFSPDFIPPSGNITMRYEHSSDDLVEHSEYNIEWSMEG